MQKPISELPLDVTVRLVVSDLDGTLLNEQKTISPRTLAAIEGLRKRGILFSVCTGREYAMLGHYARILCPTAPMVCNNGAEVISYPTGEVVSRVPLPNAAGMRFLGWCLKNGVDFCATTHEKAYFPESSAMTPFYEAYAVQAKREGLADFPLVRIQSLTPLCGQAINKIILQKDLPGTDRAQEYLKENFPEFATTMSSEWIMEVIPKGMSKAVGLQRLCAALQIPLTQCCAVGDYDNDVEMLSLAGVSVAMGNAQDAARKAAQYFTASNEEEGVAQLLELLLSRCGTA